MLSIKGIGLAEENSNKDTPSSVTPVPRFSHCLKALSIFFEILTPPSQSVAKFHFLVYGFVDASKSDLGSTKTWNNKMIVRMGTWGSDADYKSLNWREFTNLVEDLEKEERSGDLNDSCIILATDNVIVEGCLYKGKSSS